MEQAPGSTQLIYGNWKMAQSLSGLETFFAELNQTSRELVDAKSGVELAIFPSALHLDRAIDLSLKNGLSLAIGGQDCSTEKAGAFTGEISAQAQKEMGVSRVLIGHSERRKRGPESEATLLAKVVRALEAQLKIVFCVGETEDERTRGQTLNVLKSQITVITPHLQSHLAHFVLAYEPVWAIGTGKVAQISDIHEAHDFLRRETTVSLPILYGGSVNAQNASEILRVPHVNGVLVGGASLKMTDFAAIARSSPFLTL